MALSTITGISTVSATEAEQRALDCYNARYGGCPDGLVSQHSTITYAFTPTYGDITYYSEIVPTGNQGLWVYASGLTQGAAKNSWENQIASGGFNNNNLGQNCQVCTEGVTHHNYTFNDIENILSYYNRVKDVKKLILTTEKDSVKLLQFNRELTGLEIYFIPIEIEVNDKENFDKKLIEYVSTN